MSNTKQLASTGSRDLDENPDRHTIIIDGIGEYDVPGARPMQSVVVDGVRYAHVAEDAKGRWIYRRL